MVKRVLIVDDDQEMLLTVKKGLEKYDETFCVATAANGVIAMEKLKTDPISLVVTDLKMPHMNGFALLSRVMEHYPDIPVLIITAYSTPEMERLANKGGAVGYIEKPFMIEDLARKIITTLRKESEGGTLHGISSGMFLQLIEMEEKTCTIRVSDKASDKKGVLFFREGQLLDARANGRQGEAAAHEIFSWDQVNIAIQNACLRKEKKIQGDLQAVLLEAMRLKDELSVPRKPADETKGDLEDPEDEIEELEPEAVEDADPAQALWARVQEALGDRCALEDIYQDGSWDGLAADLDRIGSLLNAGRFKAGYLDKREQTDYILLPGKVSTVIAVNPRCPKEKILQILSE